MAISLLGTVTEASVANNTTLTFSHTANPGTKLLFVHSGKQAYYSNSTNPPTSITWNGTNLTKITNASGGAGGAIVASSIWYLLNPQAGTYNIVVTYAAADDHGAAASNWAGINAANPLGTAVTGTAQDKVPTVNVTAALGDLVIDGVATWSGRTPTVGAGQTERWSLNGTGTYGAAIFGSTEPASSTTVTMSWSHPSEDIRWVSCAVAMKPAGLTPQVLIIG